jgi:hypothetical protein
MPKVTIIAEQTLVFRREIEVTAEELVQMQARAQDGGQDELHLLAEDYLGSGEEHILEDGGYEAVRLVVA